MHSCDRSFRGVLFFVTLTLNAVPVIPTYGQEHTTPFSIDPELPYIAERSDPVTYDVDFSIVVTPPYKAQKLQVWLPMPTTDAAQEVTEGSLSSFPMSVEPAIAAEPVYGNKFAYFEFKSPQGAQVIRHQFKIKAWELNWKINPMKVQTVSQWPKGFAKYQQGDSQSVIVDERFETVLNEIVPQRTNPFQDFGGVMDWVQSHVAYDHHDASLKANSEHVLTKRRGIAATITVSAHRLAVNSAFPLGSHMASMPSRRTPRHTASSKHSSHPTAGSALMFPRHKSSQRKSRRLLRWMTRNAQISHGLPLQD